MAGVGAKGGSRFISMVLLGLLGIEQGMDPAQIAAMPRYHHQYLPDRILALDTLYVNSMALLVLLGLRFDTSLYFEAALIIAMLGFVGTVALSKYLLRGDIVE